MKAITSLELNEAGMWDCNHRYPYILCHNCTCTHMMLYVRICWCIDSTFLVIILVPPSSHCMLRSEIVFLTIANWTVYKTHTMSTRIYRGDIKNYIVISIVYSCNAIARGRIVTTQQIFQNVHGHYFCLRFKVMMTSTWQLMSCILCNKIFLSTSTASKIFLGHLDKYSCIGRKYISIILSPV